jgi:hypothetical protein
MKDDSAKYAILKEEESFPLLAYCSRHFVGFISDSDADFYGSGVIVNVDGTWAIATAAHVITRIASSRGVRVVFPGPQSDLGPQPASAREPREYHSLCAVVSDSRSRRDWRPDELDLGVIIPAQDVFAGIPDIAAINLRLRENPRVVTGRFCIVVGFPRRLQDQRGDMVVTANLVSSHFVACPTGARPDDIAVNWTEVFQIASGQHEDSPDACGMSGGPVFAYIDDLGGRVWTPQRQLPLAGILHYQIEPSGEYLLAHSSKTLREFIIAKLADPEQDDFRKALAAGFREPGP